MTVNETRQDATKMQQIQRGDAVKSRLKREASKAKTLAFARVFPSASETATETSSALTDAPTVAGPAP
jgi:hypothetical protein